MKAPQFWQEEDLLDLIQTKHEEHIELDFKSAGALQSTDGKKSEISKDVSAFANSIGGTILYGMEEHPRNPHHATELSPIDPSTCSKEWLEQVINSRIQPRVSGILINSIELKQHAPGKFAYAVVVPESTTAHQAYDKRYYKRFNFQAVQMEDYEIRQTMNRASRPSYKVELLARPFGTTPANQPIDRFAVMLENLTEMVGHDVSVIVFAPQGRVFSPDSNSTDFQGIPYTRITGSFLLGNTHVGAIPSAYPLVRYQMNFPKDIHQSQEVPFTVVVKVFDHFGLSLTAFYRSTYHGFTLRNEIHAAKRNPGASTIGELE
jgi:Putative DNA-binding domain